MHYIEYFLYAYEIRKNKYNSCRGYINSIYYLKNLKKLFRQKLVLIFFFFLKNVVK